MRGEHAAYTYSWSHLYGPVLAAERSFFRPPHRHSPLLSLIAKLVHPPFLILTLANIVLRSSGVTCQGHACSAEQISWPLLSPSDDTEHPIILHGYK
jgi:hypothetical protein